MSEIDRVAVLQKVKFVTDTGEVELVTEAGEVDWECQCPRDNPPEFECGECGEKCSEGALLEATRKAHYKPDSKPALPIALRSVGYGGPLHCVGLHTQCGDISAGISFEFGQEGSWVVALEDLEKVVAAARQVRAVESKRRKR